MRVGQWSALLAGAMAALPVVAVRASAQTWTAVLNGTAVTPTDSPGTGFATVSLSGTNLAVDISFSGLLGTSTASHIHCCTSAPFSGTAIVATPVPTFPSFPLGVQSGTYSDIFDLMLASSYNPAFITANGGNVDAARAALINGLNAGTAYTNVHTTVVPGGEINGYLVTTTPEPNSGVLVTSGLVAVAGVARRRRAVGGR